MTELEQREVLEHVRAMAQKLASIAMTSPFAKDYVSPEPLRDDEASAREAN